MGAVFVMAALALLSLAACSPFGIVDTARPASSQALPPPSRTLTFRLVLPGTMNPRPDSLALTLALGDGLVSSASYSNPRDTVTYGVANPKANPSGNPMGHGPDEKPLALRVTATKGGRAIHEAHWDWDGSRPGDSDFVLTWRPIYDGAVSLLDTVPELQDITVRSLSVGGESAEAMGVYVNLAGALVLDAKSPGFLSQAVDLLVWRDSLHSALRADSLGLFPLLGKPTGYCRMVPLDLDERSGYQRMVSLPAFRALWDEKSSQTALPLRGGDWVVLREEDNVFLLHALSRDSLTGRFDVEIYRSR